MEIIDFNLWLESSVAEVLESMCFLFPEAVSDSAASTETEPGWLSSKLSFSGSPCGSFWLRASPLTARAIAANFLGEEMEDVSEVQAAEVIGEMANMICGSVLSRFEPSRCFDLSSPTIGSVVAAESMPSSYHSRMFALEEGVLHVWLEIGATS